MKASEIGSEFGAKLDQSLINTVSVAGGVICVTYLLYTIPAGFLEYSIANSLTAFFCFSTYTLNRLRFYNAAFWVFALVIPLIMVGYTLYFGMINAELYLISGGVFVSFMVNKKKYWPEAVWAFVIIAFVFSKAYLFFSGRLDFLTPLEKLLFLPNATASILLVYMAARIFRTRQESQRKELDNANKLKEQLLSVLSHDIRTPLNSLKGVMELYEDGDVRPDEMEGLLSKIKNEVIRTSDFVENLLLWIREQMNGMEVNIVEINACELISETIDHMAAEINKKGLTVRYRPKSPVFMHSDVGMFKTIVRNLLANAVKFTHENTGEIDIDIHSDGRFTTLEIKDNGIGMTPEMAATLFKQGGRSVQGTGKELGYGLGLQLIKGFANHLDAEINVESYPDKGTAFVIKFPQLKSNS